jgi:hypothetical protein
LIRIYIYIPNSELHIIRDETGQLDTWESRNYDRERDERLLTPSQGVKYPNSTLDYIAKKIYERKRTEAGRVHRDVCNKKT